MKNMNFALAAAGLMTLAACAEPAKMDSEFEIVTDSSLPSPFDGDTLVTVIREKSSGCEYITISREGATPRLDRDGKQVCAPTVPDVPAPAPVVTKKPTKPAPVDEKPVG